ncbi:MAG: transposase [Lacunisphaera sp.]|nr:transposase [Lacunisphaera sp.]
MTRPKLKDDTVTLSKQELMKLLTEDGALKGALQVILQEVLECEMEQSLQAAKGERTSGRQGYRSGHYSRSLITRVGKLELRVPQDRQGRFSTEMFARYQRSEKALVAALMEARTDLTRWLERWTEKHPKLCAWVETNIEETFTFFLLPREHHKHLRSTNMLERLNQELKRRTLLVRIFPDETSCLRLSRALAIEIHEQWVEENRYLNMGLLAHERPQQTQAA